MTGESANLIACHREYRQAYYRVEIILGWTVGDEEGRSADEMDEYAQQQLKTVQGNDGVTDPLFDD